VSPAIPIPPTWQVAQPGPLSREIAEKIGAPVERVLELIELGAVYWNRDRVEADFLLHAGDYVRVHPAPRRFPVSEVDWRARLIHETDEYVVVNKPPGIPVHPTCDNRVENVAVQVGRLIGVRLHIPQRLDITTSGLFVLAKSGDFQTRFGLWQSLGRIEKRYRALISCNGSGRGALPTGEVVHYMEPADRAPRRMSTEPREGWKRCRLSVEQVVPRSKEWYGELHEVTVRLHTGRHHQIRAQLGAMGAPILGDTLYGASPAGIIEGRWAPGLPLQSSELVLPDGFSAALPALW
jgi:23S rRNA pseudouridine1911/1915/1917 synthase